MSADSIRQFIMGLDAASCVKPRIIGNTAILHRLSGASTAAISVGRIFPTMNFDFDIAFPILSARGYFCALSMKFDKGL